jgi:thiol-disulfide isomerase/thioredoxin
MNAETEIARAAAVPARRHLLYAGVAGAAALAGAGLGLWKWRTESGRRDAAAVLWPMNFDTPAGTTLAMQSLRGKPLVLNFWATWCPPCVEEMPLLDAFYRENSAKSWQVVGLAIDQPSAVRKFLGRTPVTYPIALAGLGGTELGHALGNLAGGLPYTVVIGADGDVLQRKMGRLTTADLAQWAQLR